MLTKSMKKTHKTKTSAKSAETMATCSAATPAPRFTIKIASRSKTSHKDNGAASNAWKDFPTSVKLEAR